MCNQIKKNRLQTLAVIVSEGLAQPNNKAGHLFQTFLIIYIYVSEERYIHALQYTSTMYTTLYTTCIQCICILCIMHTTHLYMMCSVPSVREERRLYGNVYTMYMYTMYHVYYTSIHDV